jgi:hypothetical protein
MKNLPVVIMIILLFIIPWIYGKYDNYKKITELQSEQIICLESSIKKYREFYDYCINSNNKTDFSECIYEQIHSNERAIEYCQNNYDQSYWQLMN